MSLGRGRRVLSIQSSVCSGYVGNRAATFPLQLLGYDVSCINTVQFSTHTGYPLVRGQKLSHDDLIALYEGLEQVEPWEGLLTGYVAVTGIKAVIEIARSLKSKQGPNRSLVWLLDPVMGDEERGLYVDAAIPALYRSVIGEADIITPNQFELQVLAEMDVTDASSLYKAIRKLHKMGVPRIVVTTFRDPQRPDKIIIVGSDNGRTFEVEADYRARPYQGTGDLFASLLMAQALSGERLEEAVINVMNSMRPILDLTGEKFDRVMGKTAWKTEKAAGNGAKVCRACELRIIESAEAILHPKAHYKAIRKD